MLWRFVPKPGAGDRAAGSMPGVPASRPGIKEESVNKHLLGVLLLLCTAVRCFSAPTNLIRNGGFETWTSQSGPAVEWELVRGQTPEALQRDSGTRYSGSSSIRFDLKPPGAGTAWLMQGVENIVPDTEYRVSGYVKVKPGSSIPLRLNIEPNLGEKHLNGGADWTFFEWTFNSREADSVRVQFRFRGEGTVWLDDVRLEQVGKAGAAIVPERAAMLKLLAYQANPVDPVSNTDTWTQSLCGKENPGKVFSLTEKAPVPQWKVGQWARYLCVDDLAVPSSRAPGEKKRLYTLVDCAVVGGETVDGKPYYWYQCVVRLDKYWVAKAQGRFDSGRKILLDHDRRVVLSFLVDGPEFKDVRRYQLKVDDEPLLEYTDGKTAVLPVLDIRHAVIRPACAMEKIESVKMSGDVPVTGLVEFTLRALHLDRSARLVNRGATGAVDARNGESPVKVVLSRPPYIGISFDGFGTIEQVAEVVKAGAGLLENQVGFYLGDARGFYNRLPAYFFNSIVWDVDIFDPCRSNFFGSRAMLDETYQYQMKQHSYARVGEVATLQEAAGRYTATISSFVSEQQRFWPGNEIHGYNSPTPAAWYDARSGVAGFVLENARLTSEFPLIESVTGRKDDVGFIDAVNIAFLAGTARRFGIWWGEGTYRWVPSRYWRTQAEDYARRGARYIQFWLEKIANSRDELSFYREVVAALPEICVAVKKAAAERVSPATAVIVVPYGYVVGMPGSVMERPWGVIDFPEGRTITRAVLRHALDLYDRKKIFDIVVDDPDFPPVLNEYQEVIRVSIPKKP